MTAIDRKTREVTGGDTAELSDSGQQLRAWKARWRLVNEFTLCEDRALTLDQKAVFLGQLMQSARALGWSDAFAREEEVVRDRWIRIKNNYRGK